MGKRLAIVEYKGKKYFFDDRLRQIRNVENPHDYADFEDINGSDLKLVEPEKTF